MWVCGEAADVVDNLKDSEVLAGATDLLRSVIRICLSQGQHTFKKISHSRRESYYRQQTFSQGRLYEILTGAT